MINHDEGTFTEPIHGDENNVVHCFMDKLDWDYEIGGALSGSTLYPSEKAIPPHKGCGVVEVEVRLKRVVRENDFDGMKEDALTTEQMKEDCRRRAADPEYQEYQRLRKKFDHRFRHLLKITGRERELENI